MIEGGLFSSSDFDDFLRTYDNSTSYATLHEFGKYYAASLDPNRLTLLAAYCCLFVLGVLGNIWVMFVVGRVFRQSRTEAPKSVQIFILALCVCELTMLAFLILLICDLVYGRWVIPSRFLCRLYLSSEGANKFCSPFLLASLSGFCYVRLRGAPTSAHSTSSTRKAVYLVTACVCFSLLLMTPIYEYGDLHYLLEFNETHILNVFPKCAFHPTQPVMVAFTTYGFVFGYAIPAALFTFFYAAALYSARNQRKRSGCYYNTYQHQNSTCTLTREGSQRGDPLVTSASPYLRRVRTTAFGLIFVYLACWTPYWSMSLYHCLTPHDQHGFESQEAIVFSYFVHMLPYINCAVFPLVYTLLNGNLKKDFARATAAQKRRRLAENTAPIRLPLLGSKIKHAYSNHSNVSTPTSPGYCSIDGMVERGFSKKGGRMRLRRTSSCQLPKPMGNRLIVPRTQLRRTLSPTHHRKHNTPTRKGDRELDDAV